MPVACDPESERLTALACRQTRDVLLRVLHERDPEVANDRLVVGELALGVARRLGMSGVELEQVAQATDLHDIGNIALPDGILGKGGQLTREEWAFIQSHTLLGERILGAAPALEEVAVIVRSTHERWDGAGYPDRLVGTGIPLAARIVFACNAFGAMTAERPYRPPMPAGAALDEMRRHAGSQFDPDVSEALCDQVTARAEELRAAALRDRAATLA